MYRKFSTGRHSNNHIGYPDYLQQQHHFLQKYNICIYNNLHYAYSQHIVLRRFAPCFILKGEKQDVEDETPLS